MENRASHRGERALARRRVDEAVAWEHEVSGGTYGAPRIRHALTRAGVDVGVRAVAASMRRLGLTGLSTRPRPARRGGRAPVAHEDHCARQWDPGGLDRVWITDFLPTCDAPTAGSTCVPCAMRTRAVSWDTPWASSKAPTWSSPHSTWPPPPVVPSPQGSCPVLIGEHSSPPRKLAAYMRAVKGTVSMGQAAVCWDNAMAESLWATLTTEYCYRRAFTTRDQVYTGVATWIEEICEVMATVPNWAERLPLDADGFECSYYRKD